MERSQPDRKCSCCFSLYFGSVLRLTFHIYQTQTAGGHCLSLYTHTERERRTTDRHRYTHRHGDTSTHTHKKSDTHRERKRERLRHKHRLTKTHKQTQRDTSSDTHKLRHIFITSHIWDRLTVRVCLCKKPSEC